MSMEWRMCVAVDSVCPENEPSTLRCQDAAAPLQSTALETVGPINELVVKFSNGLGRAITSVSADDNEEQFISAERQRVAELSLLIIGRYRSDCLAQTV